MKEAKRKEIMPFVNLTCLETNKFKTGFLSINLLTQLDRETAAKNALLPKVLLRGTTGHPDMEQLAKYKEELYGLELEPIVRKKGEIHCIGFCADFVDDEYLPDGEGLLEKTADLLGEILLSPSTSGGRLKSEYVDGERANLIQQIEALVNDKMGYSLLALTKRMCDGEAYATGKLGDEQQAQKITAASLTKHYHEILDSATIEVFYCGSAAPERVEIAVKNALMALPRSEPDYDMGTDIRMNSLEEEPRYFTQQMDVTQGKLALGFRLGEVMNAPNFAEILLFNTIYGGSVNSKLFLNVREKLSLAYQVSSMIERHKGIMLVLAGIEFDKYDTAKNEILAQLDAVRAGEVDSQEFSNARKSAITDMKTAGDSPHRLEDFYLGQAIEGLSYGPEGLAAMLESVTVERCVDIAKGVELDAVYFLEALDTAQEVAK